MTERLAKPALDPVTVAEQRGSTFPEPFKSRLGDRAKRRLGEALGLTQFGVNLVRLPPGAQSALRHWHTHEDEFIYVLEGRLTLVTDGGPQTLHAGDCAGYPAGSKDAHHLINESGSVAVFLEVGSRHALDLAGYPDDDMLLTRVATLQPDGSPHSTFVPRHKDGRPY